ncbi:hypothetical protein MP638_003489, partial [Amoeboaphelidium occidentale]
ENTVIRKEMTRPGKRRKVKNPSLKVSRRKANRYLKRAAQPQNHCNDSIAKVLQQEWLLNPTSFQSNYERVGLLATVNDSVTGSVKPLQLGQDDEWTELDGGYITHLHDFPGQTSDNLVEVAECVEKDSEGRIISFVLVKKELPQIEKKEDSKSKEYVKELEQIAANSQEEEKKLIMPRGELAFVLKCIQKHGTDENACKKAARDLKLNVNQMTPAEIRHCLQRYEKFKKQQEQGEVV